MPSVGCREGWVAAEQIRDGLGVAVSGGSCAHLASRPRRRSRQRKHRALEQRRRWDPRGCVCRRPMSFGIMRLRLRVGFLRYRTLGTYGNTVYIFSVSSTSWPPHASPIPSTALSSVSQLQPRRLVRASGLDAELQPAARTVTCRMSLSTIASFSTTCALRHRISARRSSIRFATLSSSACIPTSDFSVTRSAS